MAISITSNFPFKQAIHLSQTQAWLYPNNLYNSGRLTLFFRSSTLSFGYKTLNWIQKQASWCARSMNAACPLVMSYQHGVLYQEIGDSNHTAQLNLLLLLDRGLWFKCLPVCPVSPTFCCNSSSSCIISATFLCLPVTTN